MKLKRILKVLQIWAAFIVIVFIHSFNMGLNFVDHSNNYLNKI